MTSIFPGEDAASAPAPTNGAATPWWQDAINAASQIGGAVLQYETQKDLIELQKTRIEQGKPPIDTALLAPTVRVQADLPPTIQKDITDMKRVGVFAIGGVALAVIAFLLLRKR